MTKRKKLPPTFDLTVVVTVRGDSSVVDLPDCLVDTDLFKRGINVWDVGLTGRIMQPGIYRCEVSGPGNAKGQTELELESATRICGTDMQPITGFAHLTWANAIINTEETRADYPADVDRIRVAEQQELEAGRRYFDALLKADHGGTPRVHRLLRNLAS